jgi:hypothetical protein
MSDLETVETWLHETWAASFLANPCLKYEVGGVVGTCRKCRNDPEEHTAVEIAFIAKNALATIAHLTAVIEEAHRWEQTILNGHPAGFTAGYDRAQREVKAILAKADPSYSAPNTTEGEKK